MFTLDQARAFVAVAEELHFGHAADRLHMTQPPLSRQIQKLEKELGVTLLLRLPRGVELTAAGEAFLAECRVLLTKASQAPQRARLIAAGQIGLVKLGYTAASAYEVLGSLLSQIKSAKPDVTVELREMVSAQQLEALRNGSIDLGLARPPFHLKGVESELLLQESLVAAVPENHPLGLRGTPLSTQELQDEELIMPSRTHARYFYDLVTKLLTVREENIAHSASQVLTMVALAAAGHGIALVPESASRLAVPGVTFLQLREAPRDLVQLHAMWLSSSTNPALHSITPLLEETTD